MNKESFHENRYKIARFVGIVFILLTIFLNKDKIEQKKDTNIKYYIDSSNAKYTDKRVTDKNDDKIIIKLYQKHIKPVFIFEENDLLSEIMVPSFCGTRTTIDVSESKTHPQRLVELKIVVGEENKMIDMDMMNAISRGYIGDFISVCSESRLEKNKLECRKIYIKNVEPYLLTPKYKIEYQQEGVGGLFTCKDKVKIKYQILDKNYKIMKSGKIKEATIGTGELPIQIERGIINSRNGGSFFVITKPQDLRHFSIQGDSKKKFLSGNHISKDTSLIKIEVKKI